MAGITTWISGTSTKLRTKLTGMAKLTAVPRTPLTTTPITLPFMSSSGPPELPGLTAASVCTRLELAVFHAQSGDPAHVHADGGIFTLLESQRSAEGKPGGHDFRRLVEPLAGAQRQGGQRSLVIDLEQSEVEFLVGAHDPGGNYLFVLEPWVQNEFDLTVNADNVLVGKKVAAVVDAKGRSLA